MSEFDKKFPKPEKFDDGVRFFWAGRKDGWIAALKWVLTNPDIQITRAKSSKIIMKEIAANEKNVS